MAPGRPCSSSSAAADALKIAAGLRARCGRHLAEAALGRCLHCCWADEPEAQTRDETCMAAMGAQCVWPPENWYHLHTAASGAPPPASGRHKGLTCNGGPRTCGGGLLMVVTHAKLDEDMLHEHAIQATNTRVHTCWSPPGLDNAVCPGGQQQRLACLCPRQVCDGQLVAQRCCPL